MSLALLSGNGSFSSYPKLFTHKCGAPYDRLKDLAASAMLGGDYALSRFEEGDLFAATMVRAAHRLALPPAPPCTRPR